MVVSTVPPGCPAFGVLATKVHSRRDQQIRDVPIAGAIEVVWAKRRWFCLEPTCTRGTFRESTGVCQGFRTVGVVSGGQATAGRVVGVVCSVHALAGVR
nr:transposase family protein [Brachybacterium sp. UMB0905]